MRRFVGPNDALFFAHAHRTTPTSGLKLAFEKWGARAPVVIANYFLTAFGLCADAALGKSARQDERTLGQSRLTTRATELGLDPAILTALVRIVREPTNEHFGRTFLRLYFDRITAALGLAAGLGLLTAAGLSSVGPGSGLLLTALGGGYLAQSVLREKNRYGGTIVEDVGSAAQLVRATTGAELVVLGHTHVPVQTPGYINLGSFGFGGPARPYLLLDSAGAPQIGRMPRVAA
jgi:hypothetical protein